MSPRVRPEYREHDVEQELTRRREDLAQAEAKAEEARALNSELGDLRRDISRLEKRRDQFAELGDGHVEVPRKSLDERFRCEIEWEPLRSKKTGRELAAHEEASIKGLRARAAAVEARIAELLA